MKRGERSPRHPCVECSRRWCQSPGAICRSCQRRFGVGNKLLTARQFHILAVFDSHKHFTDSQINEMLVAAEERAADLVCDDAASILGVEGADVDFSTMRQRMRERARERVERLAARG